MTHAADFGVHRRLTSIGEVIRTNPDVVDFAKLLLGLGDGLLQGVNLHKWIRRSRMLMQLNITMACIVTGFNDAVLHGRSKLGRWAEALPQLQGSLGWELAALKRCW
jgi:hypothetical protein